MQHSAPKAIGIFGGTFDPVHLGHIKIASDIIDKLNLSCIHFLPCKQPVLKHPAYASAKQRVDMLQAAIANYPKFTIDRHEIDRNSPSYMVETLTKLRQEYPNFPLCLILGMDAFSQLPNWFKWTELLNLAHIITINRKSVQITEHSPLWNVLKQHQSSNPDELHTNLFGTIYNHNITPINISSSLIRQQIINGSAKDIEHYLPPDVWQYIKKNKLYVI